MRTLIDHGHVIDVVGHRIAQAEATDICRVLGSVQHIGLTADVAFDGRVNLRPQGELSTPEEVAALRAVSAATDSYAWRGERRPVEPTCLLCGAAGVALTHDLCGRCGEVCDPARRGAVAT